MRLHPKGGIMHEYSVGLALYDYFPSIFTGLALFFVAQMVHRADKTNQGLAIIGGSLVVLAGVLKATWKLIMATSGQDVVILSEIMFPLMAPGFLLVAFAVWSAMRQTHGKTSPRYVWLMPLAIIGFTIAIAAYRTLILETPRGYFFPFLMLATFSNIGLTVLLIREALRQERRGVALLFLVNIGMVFALQPIAAMPDKSIAIHWFEQTLTTGGAAAFALGAFSLLRMVTITLVDAGQLQPVAAVGD